MFDFYNISYKRKKKLASRKGLPVVFNYSAVQEFQNYGHYPENCGHIDEGK